MVDFIDVSNPKGQMLSLILFTVMYPVLFGFILGVFMKVLYTPFFIFINSLRRVLKV